MNVRSGILIHDAFTEEGGRLGIAEGLDPFSSESYEAVYRTVSAPLRFQGRDVERIMDKDDFEPISVARAGSKWFPEREFGLFFDAWVAVPVRVRSTVRYLDAYSGGTGPNAQEVLFGFFTNCVAATDSFAFALYAIASMLQPRSFPSATDRDRQHIKWRSTEEAYRKFFPVSAIAKLLPAISESGEFRALNALRNILAHRASPSFTSSRQDPRVDVKWVIRGHVAHDIEFTPEVMAGEALWLRSALAQLLVATMEFVEAQWRFRGMAVPPEPSSA